MQVADQIYCMGCGSTSLLDKDGEYYRCPRCGRLTLLKESDFPLGSD